MEISVTPRWGVWLPLALFAAASLAHGASPSPSPTPTPSVPPPVPAPALKFAIDGPLGGVESAYAPILTSKIRGWPPAEVQDDAKNPGTDGNPVRLQCIETPGSRFYIGLEQHMRVNAPIEKVAAVIDDFAHYQELFPDFDDVHVVSRDGNRIVTFWEQHIPVFFVPNVKYEVIYLVDASRADRRIYRYQLAKENHIKKNDGMIVIESDGPSRTRYTEYDFFDADWGPLTTFAPGKIWGGAVEGIYLSDVAIQLRAEHPDWSFKQVSKESRKLLERYPVDSAIEHKKRILKD